MTNNVNVSGGSSGSINVNATSSTTNASATSASGSSNVETVNNAAWFWANLAKEWAIKMSGLVQGEDYSSKYWAQESKGYAEQAEEIIQSKDEILAELEQEGNTQIGLIEDAGTEQIGLVESSTDAQIERIEDAGNTQITNITNVSNTNIATINGLIGDAQSAANAAANSAQSASNSATSASNSSTSASNSANSAQSSATEAASSASSASDSATAAAVSAQSAAGSATSASNSATAASGSASSAQSSATSASNSASSASSSAISASNSATSAANSASAAAISEDNAEIWAEGTDEEVQALGGIHSAKGWADVSSAGQIQADWEETDTTSKAYIRNKPSNFASSISDLTDVDLTGLSDGDVLAYDSTSQEWKAEAQSGGGVDLTAGTDLEIVSIGSQGLPNDYTLLEWVESSGLQSLSLGFSGNCTFEFTTQMAHVPTNNEVLLTSSTGASAGTWFGVNSDNTWSYSEISGSTKIDVVMNATAQGLNGTINGNAFSRNVPVSHGTWTLFNNIPASGAATFPSSMKLFALKATQNSTIIRNLIPCKNSNNVVGLYDTINGVFYSSTSGTQLIAGTVIPTGKVINFTNESGYTKNVGTVTSVNGVQPDSNGNVTLVTGGVTDVEVNGESVVTDGVAEIDLTGYQKKLTAGTDLEIVEGSTLPAGYIQLKSITSTTTQYINTKISMTANYKAVIVGRLTQRPPSNFSSILGADNQNNNSNTQGKYNVILGWGNASNGFYTENCIPSGATLDYTYSSYPWDTETHTFTVTVTPTLTMLNIDGTINTISLPPAAWDTPTPLYLFTRNTAANGRIGSITPFELEKIEQYQNGVLVFNGIPCKLGDIVGLYNTVTNEFLPNSGTGAFIEGDVIPNETIINFTNESGYALQTDVDDALESKQDSLTAGTDLEIIAGSGAILPDTYEELEYIQSDGACYIDTGIVSSGTDTIEQKFQKLGTSTTTCSWFGSMQGNDLKRVSIGSYFRGIDSQFVFFGGFNYTQGIGTADTNEHIIKLYGGSTVELDSASITYTSNNQNNPTVTSYLFARHGYDTVNTVYDNEGTRIFYHKQKRISGTELLDLVPARRIADGRLGFYNLVNNTFLTNSGSGTLTGGNVVSRSNNTVINFTNDSGFITGIDSTDVTTALGYTPYNATNPNGYTSNVGTVTSVNNELPDTNGNVTIQSGSSRNVGEIVESTIPLTDAGLHLLDGSLISGDGIYSDFVDYVQDLYIDTSTPDGTTWTPAESGTAGNEDVRFLNGQFITISGNNLNTSTDGVNWTTTTLTDFSSARIDGIAYGNNKYVALGYAGYISTSTDGVNWTTPVQNSSLGSNAWESVAYGNGKFVAIGRSRHVSTSTDGTTWTTASTAISAGIIWMSIAYGNGKFVAINSQGYIATTTDGITWTSATQNSNLGNNSWEAIEFDGTKFVAISYSGYISTSTDGVNWTVATQNSNLGNNHWVGLAYGNGKFIATTTSKRSYSYNIASGIFDTEANWQSAVTQYGVCGKFVYDSANNTVRLPKITGIVEGTTDLTALGDLVEAGLPNITGSFGIRKSETSSNTIFDKRNALNGTATTTDVSTPISKSGTAVASQPIGFDASLSNSIYGSSSTVQPQTIKVLYYIVVATSTKTQIQVDIDEIATDLNGKADTDLSNLTSAGEKHFLNKKQITNCILETPSNWMTYSGSQVTIKAGTKYLVPNGRNADGTLNNIEVTIPSDIVYTNPAQYDGRICVVGLPDGNIWSWGNVATMSWHRNSSEFPTPATGFYWLAFSEEDNYWYITADGGAYTQSFVCPLGTARVTTNGSILSINPFKPVHLLALENREEISGWSMPGTSYTNLSLGASGTSYTAPADGYFVLGKVSGIANGTITLTNNRRTGINSQDGTMTVRYVSPTAAMAIYGFIPAHKGDVVQVRYTATGNIVHFMFVYAYGSESEA